MDKDTDKYTEKDPDMDKDTNKDTDTDKELEYFCYISIRCYSPYSDVWITRDTLQRKFQQRCKLVSPLPNENYDMQIWKRW